MPSGARSTDRPALVTAPRLWGQTKDNTWLCRVMRYRWNPPNKQRKPRTASPSGASLLFESGTAYGAGQSLAVHGAGQGGGALAHIGHGAVGGHGGHGAVANAPHGGGGGAAHFHLEGGVGLAQGEIRPAQGQRGRRSGAGAGSRRRAWWR